MPLGIVTSNFLVDEQPSGAVALRAEAPAFGAGAAATRTDVFDLQRDRLLAAVVDVAQSELDGRFQVLPALRERRLLCVGLTPADARRRTCRRSRRIRSGRRSGSPPKSPKSNSTSVGACDNGAAARLGARPAASPVRASRTSCAFPASPSTSYASEISLNFSSASFGVLGIGVGMPFARELAIRGLDVFLRPRSWIRRRPSNNP